MLIWLEGCDATGKTTLAKLICQLGPLLGIGDLQYQHYSKPNRDPYTYFESAVLQAEAGNNVVADRWILGCSVYDKVLQHGTPLSMYGDQWFSRLLRRAEVAGAVLVLCEDSAPLIKERMKERGETFITEEQVAPVVYEFRMAAADVKERSKIPVFVYRASDSSIVPLSVV